MIVTLRITLFEHTHNYNTSTNESREISFPSP